jgi:hypothetical protein
MAAERTHLRASVRSNRSVELEHVSALAAIAMNDTRGERVTTDPRMNASHATAWLRMSCAVDGQSIDPGGRDLGG